MRSSPGEGIAVAQNEEIARFTLNGGFVGSASDGVDLGGPQPNLVGCARNRVWR